MNKARRHELKILKYKKRLKNYRIVEDGISKLTSFRSHGKPCSCWLCRDAKFRETRSKFKIIEITKSL
jgi:hypothetical protein